MIHTVQIETTNHCNAACIFCPRHKIKDFGVMSEYTLATIIDTIKTRYPGVKRICPQGTGEPFMDPMFLERLDFIRSQLPDVHFSIFTNGSLVTMHDVKRLEALGNLDVVISLNGPDRATREALMGLEDFDHVFSIYHEMISRRVVCRVSMVSYPIVTVEYLQKFFDIPNSLYLQKFFNIPNSLIPQFQSFGGLVYPFKRPPDIPCDRITSWLTYEWTGRTVKCCFDIEGQAECNQCTEGVQFF